MPCKKKKKRRTQKFAKPYIISTPYYDEWERLK
jgi:hypothetical protein